MAEIGKNIDHAAELLRHSELVAIPTETVYGLAANALDEKAVLQIYKVKQRPTFDPLIIHIGRFDDIGRITKQVPSEARDLMSKFWPGPLTFVLEKNDAVPDLVTAGLPTVAVRMPIHPLTQELLNKLDFPLAAPSANPFGYISPTSPNHVVEQLGNAIPYVLDGGKCEVGVESTIVSFVQNVPEVLRLGAITTDQLRQHLGKVEINLQSNANPAAPGMLSSHYAPKKRMLLGDIDQLVAANQDKSLAILAFKQSWPDINKEKQIVLSPKGDIDEAARNLFASLRIVDDMDVDLIIAEEVPSEGIGFAINDRLQRASAKELE